MNVAIKMHKHTQTNNLMEQLSKLCVYILECKFKLNIYFQPRISQSFSPIYSVKNTEFYAPTNPPTKARKQFAMDKNFNKLCR